MTNKQLEQLKAIEQRNQNGIGCVTVKKWKSEDKPCHRINRLVRDCYANPSVYKTRAEHFINAFMNDINANTENLYATDYTVLSYNGWMFTAGFKVYDDMTGELVAYYYFTRTKSVRYEF